MIISYAFNLNTPIMKNLSLLSVTLLGLLLTSCGHIYTKTEGYAHTDAQEVNGAKVKSALKPNGGSQGLALSALFYTAGSGKLTGPFLWRVEAEGAEGVHESMTIHKLRVETEKTKRDEWYPTKYLGTPVEFQSYKKTPGINYANFQVPGELVVLSEEDGAVTVSVDVSVKSTTSTERKLIQFKLAPNKENGVEFLFVPTEIIKGANKDPRKWEW